MRRQRPRPPLDPDGGPLRPAPRAAEHLGARGLHRPAQDQVPAAVERRGKVRASGLPRGQPIPVVSQRHRLAQSETGLLLLLAGEADRAAEEQEGQGVRLRVLRGRRVRRLEDGDGRQGLSGRAAEGGDEHLRGGEVQAKVGVEAAHGPACLRLQALHVHFRVPGRLGRSPVLLRPQPERDGAEGAVELGAGRLRRFRVPAGVRARVVVRRLGQGHDAVRGVGRGRVQRELRRGDAAGQEDVRPGSLLRRPGCDFEQGVQVHDAGLSRLLGRLQGPGVLAGRRVPARRPQRGLRVQVPAGVRWKREDLQPAVPRRKFVIFD